MSIIGLYSPAPQSGKSTAADHLVETLGFERHAFADPIKDMLGVILARHGRAPPSVEEILRGGLKALPLGEFLGSTSRQLQELIGETMRDRVGADIFLHLLSLRLQMPLAYGRDVVVDDLRRPNEFRYLRSIGACLVRIVRPGAAVDTSSKEGLLENDTFDVTLTNDGSIEDLREKILSVAAQLQTEST